MSKYYIYKLTCLDTIDHYRIIYSKQTCGKRLSTMIINAKNGLKGDIYDWIRKKGFNNICIEHCTYDKKLNSLEDAKLCRRNIIDKMKTTANIWYIKSEYDNRIDELKEDINEIIDDSNDNKELKTLLDKYKKRLLQLEMDKYKYYTGFKTIAYVAPVNRHYHIILPNRMICINPIYYFSVITSKDQGWNIFKSLNDDSIIIYLDKNPKYILTGNISDISERISIKMVRNSWSFLFEHNHEEHFRPSNIDEIRKKYMV